jgi:uncharacterized SAM-binding protein YcdF (DUF218 family)
MTGRGNLRFWGARLLLLGLLGASGTKAVWTAGTLLVVAVPCPEPEAIVVLASHEVERLPVAARYARAAPRARVLLTVPRHPTEANCRNCAGRGAWLEREGVAAERIVLLPDPVDRTFDEARAARRYAERAGVRRLLVVTSPYHGRRALATFRHVFAGTAIELGIALAIEESGATPDRWWRRPYDRGYVAYEYAALVKYALQFGVSPRLR